MKKFDEQFYKDRVNAFPFVKLMGMKLLSSGEGKSVMQCRIRPELRNSAGTLHGGVMGALVDMSVATALRSVMPLSFRMTTVEYKVNFLKPVPEGVVTAYGTILRMGTTIAAGSTEIQNGDGEIVAFGSATYYIGEKGEERIVPAIMNGPSGRGKKRK
jgi:uncharacterized protein (TIGR00369 family)